MQGLYVDQTFFFYIKILHKVTKWAIEHMQKKKKKPAQTPSCHMEKLSKIGEVKT